MKVREMGQVNKFKLKTSNSDGGFERNIKTINFYITFRN